ncbi:MAG: hypothetical protein JWR00_2976 [Rubritepida sp.]|nr:hypothetical protein [Rubritepida sp.]
MLFLERLQYRRAKFSVMQNEPLGQLPVLGPARAESGALTTHISNTSSL